MQTSMSLVTLLASISITAWVVWSVADQQSWRPAAFYQADSGLESALPDLAGSAKLDTAGNLQLRVRAGPEIVDPAIVNIAVGGARCANISGGVFPGGESEVRAQCGPQQPGSYKGVMRVAYARAGSDKVYIAEGWFGGFVG